MTLHKIRTAQADMADFWQAQFDDDEPNDDGQMLRGWGSTEREAINDLLEEWEVRNARGL